MRLPPSFVRSIAICAAILAGVGTPAAAKTPPAAVTAALADPTRPQADRDRDAVRMPAEIIAFAGIKPGAKVADFIMGGGYWTRILAGVVGPAGKVYAYQPAEFIGFRAAYGTEQDEAVKGRANVVADRQPLATFTVPAGSVDAILTVQNWHDLHLKPMPPGLGAKVAADLFKALKPGGVLVVVDHVGANAGGAFVDADTLHRGDPAATRKEIEGAGFRFAGESKVYAHADDPKTANVFDPAVRGKTDQFIYKFVKPKG